MQFLYESRSQTVSSVAKETGLSRPTVVAILNSLVDVGMLAPDGHDAVPTGGRPAQRYRFRRETGLLAGIDIGAHAVAARVTDLGGALLGTARRQVAGDTAPHDRIAAAAALVAQVIGDDPRPLWGAGWAARASSARTASSG
ncbi:helix-turn-helix domain-containing protein [Actinokineospora soli]|uniref:Helix-turn-helix domain-containing protein n=1 Tax=Actinokineospora soli TaxID=1048753 RepID=A0ABW2TR96_9PSEU